ncbi:MAG: ACT domain-containing protein [Planctomycetota bacterium]|jgi:hypothetical protein
MSTIRDTERGYQEPFAVQFSVFLANRVGQLGELLGIFAQEEVDVAGLSIVDSTDWAVIRVIVTDSAKARKLLKAHALPFTESKVLLVEVPTRDALSELLGQLLQAEINVHFAYTLTARSRGNPVMVFHVEDYVLAGQILSSHGFLLIDDADLTE